MLKNLLAALLLAGMALPAVSASAAPKAPAIDKQAVAKSAFLDGIHARAKVGCNDCHGKKAPEVGDTVANAVCSGCHGSYEAIAKETVPAKYPKRNPHASHLGEIDCVVCHKGHEASASYCTGCHKKFEMPIPGGTKPKQ